MFYNTRGQSPLQSKIIIQNFYTKTCIFLHKNWNFSLILELKKQLQDLKKPNHYLFHEGTVWKHKDMSTFTSAIIKLGTFE